MARILIIEKEGASRNTLQHLLEREGHGVVQSADLEDAITQNPAEFALVICDFALAGGQAQPIFKACHPAPFILLAETPSLHAAISALKAGAADYLPKPFDQEVFSRSVGEALALPRKAMPEAPRQGARTTGMPSSSPIEMIGHCRAMQQVYTRIRKVAPADVTVLVLGESGTGKELVARAIHRQSSRHQAPLICVNCAAIPETLIESELFGHEKGAFTGATSSRTGLIEAADGGTLFLDEIGELPLDAQARLLRVLQEGEIRRVGSIETRYVNVRLIAATHRNLHQLSATGEFRLDLYYRLNVMEIDLPPLRERGEDVLILAGHLLADIARKHGRDGMRLSQRARQEIYHYPWPGNVRELENALERGVILADRRIIAPEDLGLRGQGIPSETTRRNVNAPRESASDASISGRQCGTSRPRPLDNPSESLDPNHSLAHTRPPIDTSRPCPTGKTPAHASRQAAYTGHSADGSLDAPHPTPAMETNGPVSDDHAPLPAEGGSFDASRQNAPEEDLSLEDYFQHFVLEHQDTMNETELARRLGISRKNLWERRQRLGIPRRKGRRSTTSS